MVDRASELKCLNPPSAIRSSKNTDGASIDLSESMFLDVMNPIEFSVSASAWEVSKSHITNCTYITNPREPSIQGYKTAIGIAILNIVY